MASTPDVLSRFTRKNSAFNNFMHAKPLEFFVFAIAADSAVGPSRGDANLGVCKGHVRKAKLAADKAPLTWRR